jgi:type IV pilus assembly protein PilE
MKYKQEGFTLVEMLIAIAIIGILVAVAYPSYNRQMTESRRSDAHVGLLRMADMQEQFYLQNNRYGTTAEVPWTSENGWYNLAVAAPTAAVPSASAYTLTATAVGIQANDVNCAVITLNQAGQKLPALPVNCW